MVFEAGEDGDEVRFINPSDRSNHPAEREVHKYSLLTK